MTVTLYMATTIDGYVAKTNGDSDWVSELDNDGFENQIQQKGCIILGRTTYEQYLDDLYPVPGVLNIVLSTSQSKKKRYEHSSRKRPICSKPQSCS